MARAPNLTVTVACLAALIVCAPSARADDLDRSIRERDRQTLLGWTAGWNILVWPAGSTLTGCFLPGERAHRQGIVDAAGEWSRAGNIRFDFGKAPGYRDCDSAKPSDMRVGFRMSLASHSRTGTLALDAAPTQPNLFIGIGGVSSRPLSEIRETALHEIGHFLGLPHEHQHPASPCPDEFKIQAVCERQDVFATYTDRERTEMLDMMEAQVRLRRDPDKSLIAAYDVASIMHYRFPASLLHGGTASACHTFAARTLSDGDRAKMRRLYPDEVRAQHEVLRGEALRLADAISTSELDDAAAVRVSRLAEGYLTRAHADADIRVRVETVRMAAARVPHADAVTVTGKLSAEAAQCQPRAP